jgi:hypothetical protein
MRRLATIAVAAMLCAGCYHAVIETGATPSTVTVSRGWAAGWIDGLVPPSTTSTQAKCANGVAKVETQTSFPNMLANFVTLGIYSPMQIDVTCAAAH